MRHEGERGGSTGRERSGEVPALWCQDSALGADPHTCKGDLHSPSTDLVPGTVLPTIPQARLCPLQPRPTTPVFRHMDAGGGESFCTKYQRSDHSFTSSALPASASAHSFVQYCCIKSQPHARHWGPCRAQWSVSG